MGGDDLIQELGNGVPYDLLTSAVDQGMLPFLSKIDALTTELELLSDLKRLQFALHCLERDPHTTLQVLPIFGLAHKEISALLGYAFNLDFRKVVRALPESDIDECLVLPALLNYATSSNNSRNVLRYAQDLGIVTREGQLSLAHFCHSLSDFDANELEHLRMLTAEDLAVFRGQVITTAAELQAAKSDVAIQQQATNENEFSEDERKINFYINVFGDSRELAKLRMLASSSPELLSATMLGEQLSEVIKDKSQVSKLGFFDLINHLPMQSQSEIAMQIVSTHLSLMSDYAYLLRKMDQKDLTTFLIKLMRVGKRPLEVLVFFLTDIKERELRLELFHTVVKLHPVDGINWIFFLYWSKTAKVSLAECRFAFEKSDLRDYIFRFWFMLATSLIITVAFLKPYLLWQSFWLRLRLGKQL